MLASLRQITLSFLLLSASLLFCTACGNQAQGADGAAQTFLNAMYTGKAGKALKMIDGLDALHPMERAQIAPIFKEQAKAIKFAYGEYPQVQITQTEYVNEKKTRAIVSYDLYLDDKLIEQSKIELVLREKGWRVRR